MIHLGHVRMLRLSGAVFAARKALTEDGLRAAWAAVDAVKAAAEKPVASAYARILRRQEAAVLAAWERVGPGQVEANRETVKRGPDDPSVLGGLVFDVGAWLSEMEDEIGPLAADALREGFASGALRIGQDVAFRLTPRAEEELERVVGLVKGTNETTRDSIGRVIRAGMERRATVDEIAADLRATFDDWQDWRARLVAQTSVTSVYEVGAQECWKEAGVARNRWLSMRDGRVRESHISMDGEEVAVGESFSNGLTHPSEPNCRCTLLPVGFTDEEPEAKAAKVVDVSALNERELEWVERGLRDAKIRAAHEAGEKSLSRLAERFNVSESTARRAIWGA